MFGRNHNRRSDEVADDEYADLPRETDSTAQPRRRKPRRWPLLLLGLLLLIGLLPNLVGWLGLHQVAINYFASGVRGSIEIENFSAGWVQPIAMSGIRVMDDQHQLLLTAESVRTDKTLLAMATGQDYGTIEINRPHIVVQMRPDSSNIEDTFVNYLRPSATTESAQPPAVTSAVPKVKVNIIEGLVTMTGVDQRQQWQLDSVNGRLETAGSQAPLVTEIAARVTPYRASDQGQAVALEPGAIRLISQIDAGADSLNFDSIDVAVETNRLPLSVAGPVLERALGPAALAGNMTGSLQGNFNSSDQSIAIMAHDIDCRDVFFACPGLIGDDQIQVQWLACNGDAQLTPHLVSADEFHLKSDLGRIRANGNFDVQQISQLGSSGRLLDTPFEMDGKLDLARAIAMLPSTLQLHQDLNVRSGEVTFQVNSHNNGAARRLVLNLDTANLAASRGGQDIVWAKPLRLVSSISEKNNRLSIDSLSCESEFLNVSGAGNLSQAKFSVDGDLQLLAQRVGQFVDLQGTTLAGKLTGQFAWQLPAAVGSNANSITAIQNTPVSIDGSFVVDHPVVETPTIPRWAPETAKVTVAAVGMAKPISNGQTALQLDRGRMQIDLGTEQAIVVLAEPVPDALSNPSWQAEAKVTGNLNRWMAHLQNMVDLGPIAGDGDMTVTSLVTLGPESIQFINTNYRFDTFRFTGYGLQLVESSVEGTLDGRYIYKSGVLELPDFTVLADSISARGQSLQVAYPNQLQIGGSVLFRANVNRVADWIDLSPTDDSIFWFGDAQGRLNFASDYQGIQITIDTDIDDMAAATQTAGAPGPNRLVQNAAAVTKQWTPLWQDTKVKLTGGAKFNHSFDTLTLENATVQCSSLSGIVSGKIEDLYQSMNVDLKGAWRPDWDKINGLLAEMTGQALQFSGQKDQSFTVRGPLFDAGLNTPNSIDNPSQPWVPPTLFANATVGWDAGQLLDVPIGQTEFSLALNQSVAQLSTNGIPFEGGYIKASPVIDLRTAEPQLKLDRTRIVDNVQLRPDTARKWLRYVAPLVADATSANGIITVDVQSATVPLLAPEDMQVSGAVHITQASAGAGPLADQLLASIKQVRQLLKPESADKEIRTSIQLTDQTVPYLIQDARVYHKQVDFTHKDLTIRTSGSVGFDQTLQMTASIPIADDWIAGEKYLAALKGQSLTIPIGGTVTQPKIDSDAVNKLSRELVRSAAASAAQQAVQEKLTPKINQYQQKLNEKFNGGLNKLQGQLKEGLNKNLGLDKLGIGPGQNNGGIQLPNLLPGQRPAGDQPTANPKDLIKGLGDLFNNNN